MPNSPVSVPVTVNNHDVAMILDNVVRFAFEVWKSQSANVLGVTVFDAARLRSYLDALDGLHDHILSTPMLDLVKTAPREWEIEVFPAVTDVENESVNQFIRLFSVVYEELGNSASARMASGLVSHDSARFRSYIEKIRKFLADWVEKQTPLDTGESFPGELNSGGGLKGLNPTK